jgi:hypothetical protein
LHESFREIDFVCHGERVYDLEGYAFVFFTSLPSTDHIFSDLRGWTGQNFWEHWGHPLGKYEGWRYSLDLLAAYAVQGKMGNCRSGN